MRKWSVIICLLICAASFAADKANEHCLLYPSVDQHGDSLILSGLVSVPSEKPAKGILLVTHFTISSKYESPSVKITGDAAHYQEDYVLIVPDYLGYGITSDSIHPYLYGELTARNCVDMLLSAGHTLDSMGVTLPKDSIYIIGYSQGGATALWTLKLIEEQYADRIHVIKCFAGDGPYDVAATYDDAVTRNRVALPLVVPMLVVGSDVAYDLGFNRADYFTRYMERAYTKYIKNKEHRAVEIYFKMPNHRLSHWLKKNAMDKNHPIGKRLYEGLQRSSLVLEDKCPEWVPKSPLYIFHSTKDDMVTFLCAQHLQKCYPDLPNITYDFGNYGNHLMGSQTFFQHVTEELKKDQQQ